MNGINPEFLYQQHDLFLNQLKRKEFKYDGMQISCQSLNPRIIKLCNRPGNPDNWIKFIKEIKEISPITEIWLQLIIGFPTQKIEEINYEIERALSLPVEVIHFYGYSHLPGSKFYKEIQYNQIEADTLLNYLLNELKKYRCKISKHNGRSVIVSRFDKFKKNDYNDYYHQFRNLEI